MADISSCQLWRAPGGGYGTAGAQDDLALVEVGVRCSLEQVLSKLLHMTPRVLNTESTPCPAVTQ